MSHTPLHLAVRDGDSDAVQQLLNECPSNVTAQDQDGLTPLHWAVAWSKPGILSMLLDACKDLTNMTDKRGRHLYTGL
jgi:ankyrin repeat protein